MEELKRLLGQTDDEYFIGLSNKGIVKRAYKDLEQENPKAEWSGKEAEVTLAGAVCRIRIPLGESTCSCPSRSVCRHLIGAMLFLKREAFREEEKEEQGQEQILGEELKKEILAVPLKNLKKSCGNRKYREFLEHVKSGEQPDIYEGAVITVRLPWEGVTVKLLSPLSYSTCSCHSKELCGHKAQAVLACQLKAGAVTPEILHKLLENVEEWDFEELRQTAAAMKEGISLQLATGLSRLSPEASGSMERLAVISHGAGLAEYETRFREASSWYRMYFERSAGFRAETFAGRLLKLYRRAVLLEHARTGEEVSALAGTFRDSYRSVSRLHLAAIGGRTFRSKSGYEGETYYFLELEQRRWYTWTDARPTFYEGVRRRRPGQMPQASAPWGMNCSREQMTELEFYLSHARATEDGKLSGSQETKAEIAGLLDLGREEIREQVIWDYRKLLAFVREENKGPGGERLALVGAARCGESAFDPVRQTFAMDLYDRENRRLSVTVRYSKEEKLTIKVLERLSSRIREKGDMSLVFFGNPYVEEGRLCLYPIEFFEEGKIGGGEPFREPSGETAEHACRPEILRGMEQFLGEIRQVSADLFQSGLSSVREETLEELRRLARESETMGLHGAGEDLAFLEKELSGRRHRLEFDPEPVLEAWGRLQAYVELCREKAACDRALAEMEQKDAK